MGQLRRLLELAGAGMCIRKCLFKNRIIAILHFSLALTLGTYTEIRKREAVEIPRFRLCPVFYCSIWLSWRWGWVVLWDPEFPFTQ